MSRLALTIALQVLIACHPACEGLGVPPPALDLPGGRSVALTSAGPVVRHDRGGGVRTAARRRRHPSPPRRHRINEGWTRREGRPSPTGLRLASSAGGEAAATTAADLTSLRRLVGEASELHDKNLAASSLSLDDLSARISDLERESSEPGFWDASNSKRSGAVTGDIARYGRLRDEMNKWASLRRDAEGTLELLEELMSDASGSGDGEESDGEMIALTAEECRTTAGTLLEMSRKHELTTLLSGPYDGSDCVSVLDYACRYCTLLSDCCSNSSFALTRIIETVFRRSCSPPARAGPRRATGCPCCGGCTRGTRTTSG